MQRKSFEADKCPVARTLEVIGEWWTILIIRDAFAGISRFRDFQQNLGIAKNILSARLRKLVDDGILEIVPASDGTEYHEYRLTPKGRSLYIVLVAIRQWGQNNLFTEGENPAQLVDRRSGAPVQDLKVRADTGRVLGPDDMKLSGR